MKPILYKLFLAGILVAGVGCTDLEEEPVGILVPETYFKTVRDLETAVFGTYSSIAHEQFYGRKLTLTLLLRGDMCDIGDPSTAPRRQQVNDFNMDSNNGMVLSFWPMAYRIIASANVAIEGGRILGEPAEDILPLVAEARFLRGFTYYHLVRLFEDIPLIDRFITNPDDIRDISKTPADEVYALILEDFLFAKEHLPDKFDGDIRTRPTQGTAAAYLASVHLTLGNDQEAYNEAKFVIDNQGKYGYQLVADFADLYDATLANGLVEHIFAIDFKGNQRDGNQNQDFMGPVTGIREASLNGKEPGWSVAVPALAVFDNWDSRDYRKDVSFIDSAFVNGVWAGYDQFAPNHSSPRPHIGKYYGRCGESGIDCRTSDNNYVAMRYAEVLLIAAEASNNLNAGPNAEAEGYVNEVRARARNWAGTLTDFPADVAPGLDQQGFQNMVIEERRLELAFEFKRWYDVKRLALGEAVFKGANSLEPQGNFDPMRDYLMPLPQDELDRNPNLMPQNNGY